MKKIGEILTPSRKRRKDGGSVLDDLAEAWMSGEHESGPYSGVEIGGADLRKKTIVNKVLHGKYLEDKGRSHSLSRKLHNNSSTLRRHNASYHRPNDGLSTAIGQDHNSFISKYRTFTKATIPTGRNSPSSSFPLPPRRKDVAPISPSSEEEKLKRMQDYFAHLDVDVAVAQPLPGPNAQARAPALDMRKELLEIRQRRLAWERAHGGDVVSSHVHEKDGPPSSRGPPSSSSSSPPAGAGPDGHAHAAIRVKPPSSSSGVDEPSPHRRSGLGRVAHTVHHPRRKRISASQMMLEEEHKVDRKKKGGRRGSIIIDKNRRELLGRANKRGYAPHLFWLEVESYKYLPRDKLRAAALNLMAIFLEPGALLPIGVGEKRLAKLKYRISESDDRSVFNSVQDGVFKKLMAAPLPEYLHKFMCADAFVRSVPLHGQSIRKELSLPKVLLEFFRKILGGSGGWEVSEEGEGFSCSQNNWRKKGRQSVRCSCTINAQSRLLADMMMSTTFGRGRWDKVYMGGVVLKQFVAGELVGSAIEMDGPHATFGTSSLGGDESGLPPCGGGGGGGTWNDLPVGYELVRSVFDFEGVEREGASGVQGRDFVCLRLVAQCEVDAYVCLYTSVSKEDAFSNDLVDLIPDPSPRFIRGTVELGAWIVTPQKAPHHPAKTRPTSPPQAKKAGAPSPPPLALRHRAEPTSRVVRILQMDWAGDIPSESMNMLNHAISRNILRIGMVLRSTREEVSSYVGKFPFRAQVQFPHGHPMARNKESYQLPSSARGERSGKPSSSTRLEKTKAEMEDDAKEQLHNTALQLDEEAVITVIKINSSGNWVVFDGKSCGLVHRDYLLPFDDKTPSDEEGSRTVEASLAVFLCGDEICVLLALLSAMHKNKARFGMILRIVFLLFHMLYTKEKRHLASIEIEAVCRAAEVALFLWSTGHPGVAIHYLLQELASLGSVVDEDPSPQNNRIALQGTFQKLHIELYFHIGAIAKEMARAGYPLQGGPFARLLDTLVMLGRPSSLTTEARVAYNRKLSLMASFTVDEEITSLYRLRRERLTRRQANRIARRSAEFDLWALKFSLFAPKRTHRRAISGTDASGATTSSSVGGEGVVEDGRAAEEIPRGRGGHGIDGVGASRDDGDGGSASPATRAAHVGGGGGGVESWAEKYADDVPMFRRVAGSSTPSSSLARVHQRLEALKSEIISASNRGDVVEESLVESFERAVVHMAVGLVEESSSHT